MFWSEISNKNILEKYLVQTGLFVPVLDFCVAYLLFSFHVYYNSMPIYTVK